MKNEKLTKRNLLIALAANFSLMGFSYQMGWCIDFAIVCTAIWIPLVTTYYFLQEAASARRT